MNGILIAVISVTGIGFICAAILAVASKVMAVKVDDRFPAVRECLPGANCGACGYAGCDGYASALISGEGVKTNLCIPGGQAVAQELSSVLGVQFEEVEKQIAKVSCGGGCEKAVIKSEYVGVDSCKAAKMLYGGEKACTFGCIGLGDCAKVCPEKAIRMVDGVAVVNPSFCVGCGLCAAQCPNSLIKIIPASASVFVFCNNTEKGAATRKECKSGCIGCRLCEKSCAAEAIKVIDNLARIDYDKCTGCGACAEKCPTGCISALKILNTGAEK